jgi:4-hydroxybenzoate polyprenyltransferase
MNEKITSLSKEHLKKFLEYCWKQKVSPIIVGGWAVWAYTKADYSVDVDLVLEKKEELEKIRPFFTENGFSEETNGGTSFVKQVSEKGIGEFQLQHVIFDVTFYSDKHFLAENKKIEIPWGLLQKNTATMSLEGMPTRMPTIELLLVFKVKALRDREYWRYKLQHFQKNISKKRKEFKIEKDKRDIRNLVQAGPLNQAKLDEILEKTGFRDYWRLIVPEYMPMAITGLLLGFVATTQKLPNQSFILPVISILLVIAGYNSYNAVIDKEIDTINKPRRPLPNGSLTEKDAKYVALFFYAIAFLIAVFVDGLFFWFVFLAIILTFFYSYPPVYLKKRYIIGTLTAVILYTALIPLAGWSIHSELPIPIHLVFFLFLLGLPKGIMKDYVDISGDAYYQVRSMPIELGYNNSKLTIVLFYLVSAALLLYQVFEKIVPTNFLLVLLLYPLMILNVASMPKKFDSIDRKDRYFIRAMMLLIITELVLGWILIYNPLLSF